MEPAGRELRAKVLVASALALVVGLVAVGLSSSTHLRLSSLSFELLSSSSFFVDHGLVVAEAQPVGASKIPAVSAEQIRGEVGKVLAASQRLSTSKLAGGITANQLKGTGAGGLKSIRSEVSKVLASVEAEGSREVRGAKPSAPQPHTHMSSAPQAHGASAYEHLAAESGGSQQGGKPKGVKDATGHGAARAKGLKPQGSDSAEEHSSSANRVVGLGSRVEKSPLAAKAKETGAVEAAEPTLVAAKQQSVKAAEQSKAVGSKEPKVKVSGEPSTVGLKEPKAKTSAEPKQVGATEQKPAGAKERVVLAKEPKAVGAKGPSTVGAQESKATGATEPKAGVTKDLRAQGVRAIEKVEAQDRGVQNQVNKVIAEAESVSQQKGGKALVAKELKPKVVKGSQSLSSKSVSKQVQETMKAAQTKESSGPNSLETKTAPPPKLSKSTLKAMKEAQEAGEASDEAAKQRAAAEAKEYYVQLRKEMFKEEAKAQKQEKMDLKRREGISTSQDNQRLVHALDNVYRSDGPVSQGFQRKALDGKEAIRKALNAAEKAKAAKGGKGAKVAQKGQKAQARNPVSDILHTLGF